jgi:hypothetical protein
MTIQLAHPEAKVRHGFSDDPIFTVRHKIRLLQGVSKMPRHGQGAAGLYCLPNESQDCTSKLRVVPSALYPVFVERTSDDKPTGREHYVLPNAAEKDAYLWRLPGGNTLSKEVRIVGLFNDLEAEFDAARTAMKMARALHADARARAEKLDCSLYDLAYEFGVQELTNDRGLTYYSPTFTFVGAAGEPEGPTETEVFRASSLCDVVEASIAAAKREAEDRRSAILPPHRPALRPFTSGAAALKAVEAPPVESYDGPDDDIPF